MLYNKVEMRIKPLVIVFFILFAAQVIFAEDLTSTNFILRDSALTSLGGQFSATNFRNINALSQNSIGENTGANFISQLGVLYFALPSIEVAAPLGPGSGSGIGGDYQPSIFKKIVSIVEKVFLPKVSCLRTIGDLNCDSLVNIYDMSIMFHVWGRSNYSQLIASIVEAGYQSPDFNNDGKIDIRDISIVMSHWTG